MAGSSLVETRTHAAPGSPPVDPFTDAPSGDYSQAHRRARVVLAGLVLLAIYFCLSFVSDSRAALVPDSGAKIATLHEMESQGTLVPDVGYWAESADPDGTLHPLNKTVRVNGHWVQASTVPMLVVAYPLFAVGGIRAALLIPMIGAVMAAYAARALARRVSGGNGWAAFWIVGLCSPITIYALDFWEHAPAVALMLWGLVFGSDALRGRASWRGAVAAGALFGLAATMRTEALAYAVVALAVGVVLAMRSLPDRSPPLERMRAAGRFAAPGLIGLTAALVFGELLERSLLGVSIRQPRTSGTAGMAGQDLGVRAQDALINLASLNGIPRQASGVFGALVVTLVALATWKFRSPLPRDRRFGMIVVVVAGVILGIWFLPDHGYVPGLFTGAPLAAAGVVAGWSIRSWRPVGAIALLALPVVWMSQFTGGASDQWAARYLLVTSTLLTIGAVVALPRLSPAGQKALVALAALVTAFGIIWLADRTHTIASAMERVVARDDSVLISQYPDLLREGGAFYTPDLRWLTAETSAELRRAVAVAEDARTSKITLLGLADQPRPARIGPYRRGASERIEMLPDIPARLTTYER